jgi:hypothetical protein
VSSVVCESESEDMDTSDLLPFTSASATSLASASAPSLTSASVDRPAARQQLSQETQTGSDLLAAAAAAERVQTGSESGSGSSSGGGGGGPKWELLPREMLGR